MNRVTIRTDNNKEKEFENNFVAMISITEKNGRNEAEVIAAGSGKDIIETLGISTANLIMAMAKGEDDIMRLFLAEFLKGVNQYKERERKETREVLNEILRKGEEKVHG